jgi:hypothetical protein
MLVLGEQRPRGSEHGAAEEWILDPRLYPNRLPCKFQISWERGLSFVTLQPTWARGRVLLFSMLLQGPWVAQLLCQALLVTETGVRDHPLSHTLGQAARLIIAS